MQNQRRKRDNGGAGCGHHGVRHVAGTGVDVVQRISHGDGRIELSAAVPHTRLRRTAQDHRHDGWIGRRRDRLCTSDLVIPEAVFRRSFGDGLGTIQPKQPEQQPNENPPMGESVWRSFIHGG